MPRPELPPLPEYTPQLIEAYAATFIHRYDCYPIQLKDGSYATIKGELTTDLLKRHIEGNVTLGAYALNAESQAHWVCLDADEDETWTSLHTIAQDLAQKTIPCYLEPSRRGGHLWLFTPTLAGKTARQFGQGLCLKYGLPTLEIYPKQAELKTGVGSLVRLPLGIHRKSGRRYHFWDLNRQPLAPTIRQQMAILAQPERVPLTFIEQIIAEIPAPSTPSPPKISPIVDRTNAPYDTSTPLSERLKAAISVQDFVSQHVSLDAQGKGFCPFHDDQHASFQVNPSGNYWSCYAGCGGGSIVDFWMKWRENQGQDGSFQATIKDLASLIF
jgi:hypothetical protein